MGHAHLSQYFKDLYGCLQCTLAAVWRSPSYHSNSQSFLCAEVKVPQSLHPRIALFLLSGKGGVLGPDHALTG